MNTHTCRLFLPPFLLAAVMTAVTQPIYAQSHCLGGSRNTPVNSTGAGADPYGSCIYSLNPDISGYCNFNNCDGTSSGQGCSYTDGNGDIVHGTWSCPISTGSYTTNCSLSQSQPPACPGVGNCTCYSGGSPIVIDTEDEGFHLTDQLEGVKFDWYGTGSPIPVPWTNKDYANAWLALDRNGNGKIDSAKELFGDITDQPASSDPNGFAALAVFDEPANGGNGDGIIDTKDSVYGRLRLWIDSNHDGISQPSELYTLESKGIAAIGLKYTKSALHDEYGNLYRFKGSLVDAKGAENNKRLYDVFLKFSGSSKNAH